ncbi:MAG: SufD family Fe-S cluster assembly protein [Acholeplasmatales bacterium]
MEIIIKDHQINGLLPNGVTYKDNKLTFNKNTKFDEVIKIKLKDDNNESFEVIVGDYSKIKIILEISSKEKTPHSYNFSLTLNKNSNVTYLLISDLNSEKGLIHHEFKVHRDANLELLGGLVSNKLEAKIEVELLEENANANLKVVVVSSNENIQKVDVNLVHKAPHTTGLMHNVGISGGNGKIILNGVEQILKGMNDSNAYQSLKGIITSDDAYIEVNPILLIDEYDVIAGHGATVGRLEELSIYYLMSRGLSKREAELLMINGLLAPVVNEISDEKLKTRFQTLVNERL